MNLNRGLYLDTRHLDMPNLAWNDVRNMMLTSGFKSITNEKGFDFSTTFEFPILGKIELPNGYVRFSIGNGGVTEGSVGTTKFHKIETYINSVRTTILRTQYLRFDADNPIEGVFQYNYENDLIVAWCHGVTNSSDRLGLLNLTSLPFSVDANYEIVASTLSTISELSELCYMFPDITVPSIIPNVILDGGNMTSGRYFYAIAYNYSNQDITNLFQFSEHITIDIIQPFILQYYDSGSFIDYPVQGSKITPGENCNKSVKISISTLDTKFEYFTLFCVYNTNGSFEGRRLGKYKITSSSMSIVDTGNYEEIIDIADIIIDDSIYKKSQTLTIANNKLHLGNVTIEDTIDYQKYANNIKTAWVETSAFGVVFNDGLIRDTTYRGLVPEEVYAFYIYLIHTSGNITKGFHIPGRIMSTFIDSVYYNENALMNGVPGAPTQYPNASANEQELSGARYFQLRDTAGATSNVPGNMAFWENEDEYYPQTSEYEIWETDGAGGGQRASNYSELINNGSGGAVKIRHHKAPNLKTLTNNTPSNIGTKLIGVNFTNIYIPTEIANQIQGYFIAYADKQGNTSIIATCPALANNYSTNTPRNHYRILDRKLLYTKPSLGIGSLYLRGLYKSTIANVTGTAHIASIDPSVSTFPANYTDNIQYVEKFEYYPENNSSTEIEPVIGNTNKEECAFIFDDNTSTIGHKFQNENNTTMWLINLCNLIKNPYFKFDKQTLVLIGIKFVVTGSNTYSTGTITKFDSRIGNDHFQVYNTITAAADARISIVGIYSTESPSLKKIYTLGSSYNSNSINPFEYDEYIFSRNNIKSPNTYNILDTYVSTFPYKIPVSNSQQDENLSISWRYFKPASYYEMPRSKGVIWKLTGLDKILFIHHTNSLFIARVKDILSGLGAGDVQTYLGIGDIFDRPPDEIVYEKSGYIGNQSKFAAFICKYGYFCIDRERGKIFIITIDGKPTEISKLNDNKEWFENNLQTAINIDNPYVNSGIIATYDEDTNRFLITKNDSFGTSYTISFHPDTQLWIAKHDYIPNAYISTRSQLLSDRIPLGSNPRNQLYIHNSDTYKGLYYSEHSNGSTRVTYPSYIDVVFNDKPNDSKIIESVLWQVDTINDGTGAYVNTRGLTKLMLYNNTQCSDILDLTNLNKDWFEYNPKYVEDVWIYNEFVDAVLDDTRVFMGSDNNPYNSSHPAVIGTPSLLNVSINSKDFFEKSKFIAKFVIVRFQYDNLITGSRSDTIYLTDVGLITRLSYR